MASGAGQQYLQLTIPKNPAATDVIYTGQGSTDLAPASWSSTGGTIVQNTATLLRIRTTQPLTSVRQYLRVLVSLVP